MVPQHFPEYDNAAVCSQLRDVGQRLIRAINEQLVTNGVTYSRTRILFQLAERGPLRATDFAHMFRQAPRTVTESIDRLERDGLVVRKADADDRRVKHIHITASGRQALTRSTRAGVAVCDEMATMLGRDDMTTLKTLLDRIDHHLDAAAQEPDDDSGATK